MKTQCLSTDDKLTTNLDCIETKFIIIYHIIIYFFQDVPMALIKRLKGK